MPVGGDRNRRQLEQQRRRQMLSDQLQLQRQQRRHGRKAEMVQRMTVRVLQPGGAWKIESRPVDHYKAPLGSGLALQPVPFLREGETIKWELDSNVPLIFSV